MKLALIQVCSVLDPQVNLTRIQKSIEEVKALVPDVDAIILPEVFYSMSDGLSATPYLIEENNEHYQNIVNLARNNSIAILGGSAATKVGDSILNRSYNFDKNGNLLSAYDKTHLFRIDLGDKTNSLTIDEGKTYSAGKSLEDFNFNGFHFGLSVCFDLRFPELYRAHFKNGCNVFLVSSAFTQTTGKAHWETLLKARAIENQAYVVACNQWGKHNEKLSSYGHSMVIDPWGEVMADAGEGESFIVAELNLERVNKIRSRMDMQRQLPT